MKAETAPNSKTPALVAAALGRGAQVLTASARAARALGRAYAEDARARGQVSWRAPLICDLASWLTSLHTRFAAAESLPGLLAPLQEEWLWREAQGREAALVVSPERLARLAQSGYARLSAYSAHGYRRASWAAAHEDAERFLGWADAFDARCAELSVMSRSGLEAALARSVRRIPLAQLPRELLLLGFDRLTPAQEQLLGALADAGVEVQHAPLDEPAGERRLLWAADGRRELESCALWVRARLEANPAQRIGVLMPELQGTRAALDRVFRRVLQPEAAQSPLGGGTPPYEFSLGTPLAGVLLIASALLLLRWLAGPLPAAEISSLLLSGFIAVNEAEALAEAESDASLRRAGLLTTELGLPTLLRHAARKPDLLPSGLLERLLAAEAQLRRLEHTRRRPYTDWAEAVPSLLETVGWPGFRELSSIPYQARERWDALLDEVAQLSFAGRALPWKQFVSELSEWARQTLFAPESRHAPVQILGIDEAAGLQFDAVWLLGANEGRWPRGGTLHPLLAPGLQRDAGMPHSRAEDDLALAQAQLGRVLASAPVLVASYARMIDGAEARLSPMLRDFAPEEPAAGELPIAACAVRQDRDTQGPLPWPTERIAGGSEVLKRQSACGFQGFAVKRLWAEPLNEESWGLDAGDRATLLHRALERLWSTEPAPGRLHQQEDLRKALADNNTLDEMVRAAVAASFASAMRDGAGDRWRQRYLELEQRRLGARLHAWLREEANRAEFVVDALEQKLEGVPVGPLRLNLRIDRVDHVNGGRLLLDYKTAERVSTNQWNGERPDEPQLPIYALFGGIADVAGVAFAQIRAGAGKTKLHALAEEPEIQVSSKTSGKEKTLTPEIREEWARALLGLAEQFARGDAPVNPKNGAQTCRLCGLYGLCRVRSLTAGIAWLEDGDD